jgi:hypothetical protein
MKQPIAKMWYFSSSSGSGTYETLQYEDESISCNCPGWTRRVAIDGSRSCKHTRMIESGHAGVPAMDYTTGKPQQDITGVITKKPAVKIKAPAKPASEPEQGKKIPTVRHIQWD